MLTFFKRLASSVATPAANKVTVFVDDAGTPSYKDDTGTVHSMVGATGQGVPAGGTVGQALTKASNTDYDTQWHTLTPADIGAATAAQGAKADAAAVDTAVVHLAGAEEITGSKRFTDPSTAPVKSETANAESLWLTRTGRTPGNPYNSVIRYRIEYTDSSNVTVYFGLSVSTTGVVTWGVGSSADLSTPANQWLTVSATQLTCRVNAVFSGTVTANQNFASSTTTVVLAPSAAGTVALRPNGPNSSTNQITITSNGATTLRDISFAADNTYNVGSASLRPIQYYGVNTTISSSDARLKTDLRDISDAEVAAFSAISRLPMVWKWLERVQEEGEEARMHSGPTVQAAIAIMEANNLDWTNYSAFCYDQWEETPEVVNTWEEELDEEGNVIKEAGSEVVQEYRPAGDRYSFRREELLWWCHRAMVVQYDKLEARVAALESKG